MACFALEPLVVDPEIRILVFGMEANQLIIQFIEAEKMMKAELEKEVD